MVVLIRVLRIAVNSNPSGSNGAKPKEFPSRRGFKGSARNPEPLREAL
jgi:hypothetical protein